MKVIPLTIKNAGTIRISMAGSTAVMVTPVSGRYGAGRRWCMSRSASAQK